jgi:hypothetical protein
MDCLIWTGPATDIALQHPFVLDIMLALSATHIASEAKEQDKRATYLHLALEYQNQAVVKARDQLHNVCETNCNALFAFTTLNFPTSVVLAQLSSSDAEPARSPLDSVLISSEWLRCLLSIMLIGEPWIRAGPFKDAYDNCDGEDAYNDSMRPAMQRLVSILATSDYATRDKGQHFKIYSNAVEMLEDHFIRSQHMAIAWPGEVGPAFIQQLQARDGMAMLIAMHWGVLLYSLDMWWASFTGKRLVDQISRDLQALECHDNTSKAIEWARLQVGLEVDQNRM